MNLKIESKLKLEHYSRGFEDVDIMQVKLKDNSDDYTYFLILSIVTDNQDKGKYINVDGVVGISEEGYAYTFTELDPEAEENYTEILAFCEENIDKF